MDSLLTNGNPAVVLLQGGIYSLSSPINPMTSGGSGSPIVYAAYPGQSPIITGAQPLKGWTHPSSGFCHNISDCYQTTLATNITNNFDYLIYVPGGWPTTFLPYLMNRRTQSMNVAANPSVSPYNFNACTSATCSTSDHAWVTTTDISTLFSFGSPYNLEDIKYYNFNQSSVDVLRISAATQNAGTGQTRLDFTSSAFLGVLSGGRYALVNSFEYFKTNAVPGTFYIDCGSGTPCVGKTGVGGISGSTIYYIKNSGEDPTVDLILAPQLSQLVTDGPNGADNLTFEGLTFTGDNFVTDSSGYVSQAAQSTIPAALSFVDTTGITIDSSIVAHTSGWGVEFTNDQTTTPGTSQYNALVNSALYDIGASGLRLGRYPLSNISDTGNDPTLATQNTMVSNNLFLGMGRIYPNGETGCIWIGSSLGNMITHNECGDSYGGGVAIGPSVATQQAYVYGNNVQYNNFHDIGEGVLSDIGCVHFANRGCAGAHMAYPSITCGDTFANNVCRNITHALNDPAGFWGTATERRHWTVCR